MDLDELIDAREDLVHIVLCHVQVLVHSLNEYLWKCETVELKVSELSS